MIDKKNRREKNKRATQHNAVDLNLINIVAKSRGARAKPYGQGANLETPSKNRSRRIAPRPAKPPPGQATSFSGTRKPFNSSIFVNGFHLPWDNLERIPLFYFLSQICLSLNTL